MAPDTALIGPPLPDEDSLTQFFWDGVRGQELWILRCDRCGHHIHWPRPVCRWCLSMELSPARMSGAGVVYSYTVARQAFHPWFSDKLPYVIAIVELVEEQGLRMVSNLIDCEVDAPAVGAPVQVTFETISNDLVLPMFRLQANSDSGGRQ